MLQKIKKLSLTYFLNVLGLTVALASFIMIMIQVNYDLGFDNFYKHKDRIFRLEVRNVTTSDIFYTISISRPLGIELGQSSPDIELYSCWSYDNGEVFVKREGSEKEVSARYTTWSYSNFELFEFKILAGNIADFTKPDMVAIPESLAKTILLIRHACTEFE